MSVDAQNQSSVDTMSQSIRKSLVIQKSTDKISLKIDNKRLKSEVSRMRQLMSSSFDQNSVIKELKAEIECLMKDKSKLKHQINKLQKIGKMKSSYSYVMNKEIQPSIREQNLKQKITEFQTQLQNKTNFIITLQKEAQSHKNQEIFVESLKQELSCEITARKVLHNQLQDLKGNIRVFCRVRPLSQQEHSDGHLNVISKKTEMQIIVQMKDKLKQFNFDACFEGNDSQKQIFLETKGLIQSAIDGYNICIFAFGQTGSGKTYTMQGNTQQPGLTPRIIHYLFSLIEKTQKTNEFQISCTMIELYKTQLIDLLVPKKRDFLQEVLPLSIKEDSRGCVYVKNLKRIFARSEFELNEVIQAGIAQRETSTTEMSIESSRSHLITTITIESLNKSLQTRTFGKISLIDLAGSERMNKANPTHNQLQEAKSINKSLSALFDVISKLTSPQGFNRHIPYRSHKLTMLMKDSLGGNSKTLMFLNLSPASYNLDESLQALFYASVAKKIVNHCGKNVESQEMVRLKQKFSYVIDKYERVKRLFMKKGHDLAENNITPIKKQAFHF